MPTTRPWRTRAISGSAPRAPSPNASTSSSRPRAPGCSPRCSDESPRSSDGVDAFPLLRAALRQHLHRLHLHLVTGALVAVRLQHVGCGASLRHFYLPFPLLDLHLPLLPLHLLLLH